MLMTHNDILRQIPDYVLGLLPPGQMGTVEYHVAQCDACRKAIKRERKFGQLVRATIEVASKPEATRLGDLMPPLPHRKRSVWGLNGWQKQLAPLLLVLLVALGGFILQRTAPEGSVPALVTTAHAATATTTNTPTATVAQYYPLAQQVHLRSNVNRQINILAGCVAESAVPAPPPGSTHLCVTPDPLAKQGHLPTPVADIVQISAH